MATDTQTIISRQDPEVEAYYRNLMAATTAMAPPALPGYEVAGMTQAQMDAVAAARQGIGSYQPYLGRALEDVQAGGATMGEAADYLRGADTSAAMQRAQQMMGGHAQAGLAPSQAMLGQSVQAMQAAGQDQAFGQGIGALYSAAQQGREAGRLGAAPTIGAQQFGQAPNVGAQTVGMERVSAPTLRDLTMQGAAPIGAERTAEGGIRAAQTGYSPELQVFQMGPAERVQTQSFAQPGSAQAFMSPYMQSVVEAQQREATRQSDIMGERERARFAQAGAFGGSRQAVMEAERERNLLRQLGDIQATGSQQAFQQAQQQFNTEQQAQLAAQQANQAAGLNVGGQNLAAALGVQQLGAGQIGLQTSLANLSAEQQARVQSEANRLQAQGMNQQAALQAAMANQGVQQQTQMQNLGAGLQMEQLRGQMGLQSQQLNQAANLQAQIQNQAANLQAQGMNQQMAYQTALQNAQLAQQAAMANQQMQGQYGLAGSQQQMQAAEMLRQAGMGQIGAAGTQAGLGQQAAQYMGNVGQTLGQQAFQQAGLGQQAALGIGSLAGQQANIGMGIGQGLGSLGAQYANLGMQTAALGQTGQALGQQDLSFLYNLGTQQQRQEQAELDAYRANVMQSQMQPYQHYGYLSDIYRGAPSSQMQMAQMSQATASPFQQIAGLATAGLTTAAAARTAGLFS